MWVLLAISFVVIALVIEKYRAISRARKQNEKLLNALQSQDKLDSIKSVLRIYGEETPLCQILSKLYNEHLSDEILQKESLETAATMEMHKLEKGMGWLSTFAAVAPLIGFLGTVMGMVRVFMNIQGQNQSGIDISILAGGIWEALLTTVGGLIVGIIAIIFYNDLVQNLENMAKEMQDHTVSHMIRIKSLS
ncbi:MAG: biopolymer transporter ExbB [Candidatus Cloacimonetes bacterium HGW-Cloacimonetes-2]|nr:MAG: biopolymer transporter ExbB [Candidatus Cloacimonetes bacterium HGW-Cloacimonetes-2]